jgi:hypothetical protein
LVLTYYGDGPRWDNAILLAAYPPGHSYGRPFRYRDKWVTDELRQLLDRTPNAFVEAEATIGMRFYDPAFGFVPLRDATVSAVRGGDANYIHFRLGPLHDYEGRTLCSACRPFPEDMSSTEALMFLVKEPLRAPAEPDRVAQQLERWAALADAIAREDTLPVSDSSRRGIFFAAYPAKRSRSSRAHVVANTDTAGPLYGYRVAEGESVEVVVAHRVPRLIGSPDSVLPVPIKITSSNENYALSASERTLTSNYDQFPLTFAARNRQNVSTEVSILPPSAIDFPDGSQGTSAPVQLMAGVRLGFLYRLRTQVVPLVVIWAAFFFLAYEAGLEQFKGHGGRLVVVAAISGVASLIITLASR